MLKQFKNYNKPIDASFKFLCSYSLRIIIIKITYLDLILFVKMLDFAVIRHKKNMVSKLYENINTFKEAYTTFSDFISQNYHMY